MRPINLATFTKLSDYTKDLRLHPCWNAENGSRLLSNSGTTVCLLFLLMSNTLLQSHRIIVLLMIITLPKGFFLLTCDCYDATSESKGFL